MSEEKNERAVPQYINITAENSKLLPIVTVSMEGSPSTVQQDNGGLRYDDGKARYDLIPPEAMEALAHHYRVGSVKYGDRNWERGMNWCRCFASMMRHSWAWLRGEDIDPETGSHHMVAVAWNAITLFVYHERKAGADDRPIVQKQKD